MGKTRNNINGKFFSVEVEASSVSATNSRIIIVAKDYHRSIPAVVFSPEKAEAIVDIIEESYTTSNKSVLEPSVK